IMYNANDAQAKIQYMGNDDCTIYTLMCPYGHPHPASLICIGEGQDVYWTYDSSNCGSGSGNTGDSGSGGDSGTGDSGSDSGGGGNTGGTPGDEDYDDGLVDPKTCKGCGGVVTVPVPELEELEQVDKDKTPCEKIIEQLNDSIFKTKENLINNSSAFHALQESGFSQNLNGSFNLLTASGSYSLDIPLTNNMIGFIHSHINSFERDTNGDGIPDVVVSPIKMPSPGDIVVFLRLLTNAHNNQISLMDIYGSMYSSSKSYTLKFTGDINDVIDGIDDLRTLENNGTLEKKFIEYFEDYNNKEKAFLKFLKNEIGIDGIRLFKINGTIVREKFLDENGDVNSQDC
ncbi:hypothetical protein, partial [Flavobacterium sp. U410]